MTRNTAPTPDVPWPAGALQVGEWKPAPNGDSVNRQFRSKAFPVSDLGSVATGGYQLVAGDDTTLSVWTVTPLNGVGHLSPVQAEQFAQALYYAARYAAEMEAVDIGLGRSFGIL